MVEMSKQRSGFAERLRRAMRVGELSQRKLAKITGITSGEISRLYRGTRGALVSYERVVLIARACGVSDRWLGLDEGEPPEERSVVDEVPNRAEAARICRAGGVPERAVRYVEGQTLVADARRWSTLQWIDAIRFAVSFAPELPTNPATIPPPTQPSATEPGSHVRPRADTTQREQPSTERKK